MVRRLVFMQVCIAQGKLAADELIRSLEAGSDALMPGEITAVPGLRLVHGLAPAQGLVLAEVHYPPEVTGLREELD
jgi:hypothetical protein